MYRQVADSFTVIDIAEPIEVEVGLDTALWDAAELFMTREESESEYGLVVHGDRPVGYVVFDPYWTIPEEANNKYIREVRENILLDRIIPDSMPLMELVRLFESDINHPFFVLSGNQIQHVVEEADLDKLPMHLCLFSVILELEYEMSAFIGELGWDTFRNHIRSLPKNRITAAEKLHMVKFKTKLDIDKISPSGFLRCANFVDKVLLLHEADICGKLPFRSEKDCRRFFKKVELLRNEIAHGGSVFSVVEMPLLLNSFTKQLNAVVDTLESLRSSP